MREQAPLASALQYVKDSVEDLAKIVDPRSSTSFGSGHVGLDVVPFGIGEICRVRLSHA